MPSNNKKRSLDGLKGMEKEIYSEILKLKLQHKAGNLKQTASIKMKKKELARVKTELSSLKEA